MSNAFKLRNVIILILSVAGLYILAPSLDKDNGPFVSLSYALILIISSGLVFDKRHLLKYTAFIGLDMVTYYILYNDQPWDFLFHTGIWADSPIPLIGCSIIMAFSGWLLIETQKQRWLYVIITLGLQVPVGLFIGTSVLQEFFGSAAQGIGFKEYYPGAIQLWQFEWMLTYYLPIYFFARGKTQRDICRN